MYFRPHEDLHGYATLLRMLCTTYGLPLALYGDRLGVFVRNDSHWTLEEELRGTQDPTHFGRILQELGIGYIAAHSPQAKGRIERFWQTLQDRLVSELRLRGISTLEAAHAFLPAFLADLNPRFARAPPTPSRRGAPCRVIWPRCSAAATRAPSRGTIPSTSGPVGCSCPGAGSTPAGASSYEALEGRLLVFIEGRRVAAQPASASVRVTGPANRRSRLRAAAAPSLAGAEAR